MHMPSKAVSMPLLLDDHADHDLVKLLSDTRKRWYAERRAVRILSSVVNFLRERVGMENLENFDAPPFPVSIRWILDHMPSRDAGRERRAMRSLIHMVIKASVNEAYRLFLQNIRECSSPWWLKWFSTFARMHIPDRVMIEEEYAMECEFLKHHGRGGAPPSAQNLCLAAQLITAHDSIRLRSPHQFGYPATVIQAIELNAASAIAWELFAVMAAAEGYVLESKLCWAAWDVALMGDYVNEHRFRYIGSTAGYWTPCKRLQGLVEYDTHTWQVFAMLLCKRREIPRDVALMIAAYICAEPLRAKPREIIFLGQNACSDET